MGNKFWKGLDKTLAWSKDWIARNIPRKMFQDKKICVIVPALNEELLLPRTISGMPSWIDKIIIIDDGSSDNMPSYVESVKSVDARIELIKHQKTLGLGQSLIDGYLAFLRTDGDICVVMAETTKCLQMI